jgi:gas vesicle protein
MMRRWVIKNLAEFFLLTNKTKYMSTTSKVIIGTLAGVTAGVVLGLLFAPDKGTETRRKITERYSDLSEGLRTKINDLVDTVRQEYGNAKEQAQNFANRNTGGSAPNMRGQAQDSYTG